MRKYKTENMPYKKLISLTCDKCKKEYDAEDYIEAQEFVHIDISGGYGSVFGDGTHVECDICQRCLKEMIGDICRETEISQ